MKISSSRRVVAPFVRRRGFILQHRDQFVIRAMIEAEAQVRAERTAPPEHEEPRIQLATSNSPDPTRRH